MVSYEIEREIVIDAPVDVVWRTVTEPDQITQWFADRVELELKPGGRGGLWFEGVAEGGPLVVEAVEPPTLFSFRWNHPSGEEPTEGNSMLVEFTLTPEGTERTRLRVVETGLEQLALAVAEKERYAREHNGGWARFLGRLADLVAERQG
jgi:uncharacterized protein YndB with AHSA1/START domain